MQVQYPMCLVMKGPLKKGYNNAQVHNYFISQPLALRSSQVKTKNYNSTFLYFHYPTHMHLFNSNFQEVQPHVN